MPNVFIFGDKIPEGNINDKFIAYNAPNTGGGFLMGPYTNVDEKTLLEDYNDIKSYDGVVDVKIVTRDVL